MTSEINTRPTEPQNRLLDLLVDETLQGLSNEESRELQELQESVTFVEPIDSDAFEIAAATLAIALTPIAAGEEELPRGLSAQLRDQAKTHFDAVDANSTINVEHEPMASIPIKSVKESRRQFPVSVVLSWVVAAAAILMIIWNYRPEPSLDNRMSFIAETEGVAALQASDYALATGARGNFTWSQSLQEGYLQLQGLPTVDPGIGIYQLWIFDDARDERYPVDGGTFAINDDQGETVIPIDPALPVRSPSAFVITLEPPGGVVVSDRKRIMLVGNYGDRVVESSDQP